ncbi:MAG: beta-glucuronidase, partial [Firmicutes bacterium]|nr:beta-glucuronidase [Bacillota bacterium]
EGGEERGWFRGLPDPEPMAVPASFNELVARPELRDFLGSVWYFRRFFVPASWAGKRIWLRFGAVNYRATVWVNGRKLTEWEGGHLPFAAEATSFLRVGEENTLAVKVNNLLDWATIPPGRVIRPPGDVGPLLEQYFDFFHYAGIHRSVHLYATGPATLRDLTIRTRPAAGKVLVSWSLERDGEEPHRRRIRILDHEKVVAEAETAEDRGELAFGPYRLWAPGHPHLYRFRVDLLDGEGRMLDSYTEDFGIRTVAVEGDRLLLNGEPVYLKGCCRHEDFHLVGRGLLLPLIQKDLNLLRWLGANSFRTSHYPYAEETMMLADRLGLLVIDECPAVGLNAWGAFPVFVPDRVDEKTLATHLRLMEALYRRDKNHPSVIAWSVANEPASEEEGAVEYFARVVAAMRALDPTRPVTFVASAPADRDRCGHLVDFIAVNRYFGWYTEEGRLDLAAERLRDDLRCWHRRYGKPVMLTEFGADTVAGLHTLPPQMFSEEYQVEFLRTYARVLDELDFIIGEHVWNLADFMTNQGIRRVVGNRKGVFTRERQPKMAAHYLRERWTRRK